MIGQLIYLWNRFWNDGWQFTIFKTSYTVEKEIEIHPDTFNGSIDKLCNALNDLRKEYPKGPIGYLRWRRAIKQILRPLNEDIAKRFYQND